ncbi:MAG TPA: DNA methyltransferase [Candidatus Binataceae bacterium]|nr:DNA methyltransferase [Candidatus Binataceae bacterium]
MNGGRPNLIGDDNRLRPEDRAAHHWYRFVLSFPPQLIRTYVERFGLGGASRVLDPFCGTGTTLVECRKLGVPSVGLERNPMAHLASRVKVNWEIEPASLLAHARIVAGRALNRLRAEGIADSPRLPLSNHVSKAAAPPADLRRLPPEAARLLLKDSISPLPLHKTLVLLEALEQVRDDAYYDHERLALARTVVFEASNLNFGPEVGAGPPKSDAAVIAPWLEAVKAMAADLEAVRGSVAEASVRLGDARDVNTLVEPCSIDAVVTSPPYPNEKDYTRTTRLESVLLGFIRNQAELRALKKELVRSNTRSVYSVDRDDDLVANHREIQRIAAAIEQRRLDLGKTSGFERMYARVTRLYFGGMARHLASLRGVLKPGARLAYVVGDQASYLRVMIRTGQLLADIAQSLGYEVESIDLFRTRLATVTREALREEVVVLRWPGSNYLSAPSLDRLYSSDRRRPR